MIVDEPFGGEPWAVASADFTVVRGAKPDEAGSPPPAQAANVAPANAAPPPGTKTVTIIDGMSGKREEIFIPSAAPPGSPDAKARRQHRSAPHRDVAAWAAPEDRGRRQARI